MDKLQKEIRWLRVHGLKMAEKYRVGGVPGHYDRVVIDGSYNNQFYRASVGYVQINPKTYNEDFCPMAFGFDLTPKTAYRQLWRNYRTKRRNERLERLEALQDEILQLSESE